MPFRLRPTPTSNVNAGIKKVAASKAQVFAHVARDDDKDDLAEAGKELGAVDYEVGAGAPKETGAHGHDHPDHLESPVYPDAIQWGPERAVAHVPFKLKEK